LKRLLANVGVSLTQNTSNISFGATISNGIIIENTIMGSSAYKAGLENGDKIVKVGDLLISDSVDVNSILRTYKPNDEVNIVYERLGIIRKTTATLQPSKTYSLSLFEANNMVLNSDQKANRESWLQPK